MFRFQEDSGILKNFILGDSDVSGLAPELEGMQVQKTPKFSYPSLEFLLNFYTVLEYSRLSIL